MRWTELITISRCPSNPGSLRNGLWEWMKEAEDRSLDRMIEMMRRDRAATRAVMRIKEKIRDAGIFVPPSSKDHFLMEADFRGWAKTETDPKKKAELISLGNLAESLGRTAHGREVEAKAAKKRSKARKPPAPRSSRKPRPRS
jgi:hypothetical protein